MATTTYHLMERCGDMRFTTLYSGSVVQMAFAILNYSSITMNRRVELPDGGYTVGDTGFICVEQDGAFHHTDIGDFIASMMETFNFESEGWYEAWIGTPGVDARMVWSEFTAHELFDYIVHTDAYEHGYYEYHEFEDFTDEDGQERRRDVIRYAWRSTWDIFHFMEPDCFLGYVDEEGIFVYYSTALNSTDTPDPDPEYAELNDGSMPRIHADAGSADAPGDELIPL